MAPTRQPVDKRRRSVGVADLTPFGRKPKILGQFFDSETPPAIYHLA
jgi:hypothetical protein